MEYGIGKRIYDIYLDHPGLWRTNSAAVVPADSNAWDLFLLAVGCRDVPTET